MDLVEEKCYLIKKLSELYFIKNIIDDELYHKHLQCLINNDHHEYIKYVNNQTRLNIKLEKLDSCIFFMTSKIELINHLNISDSDLNCIVYFNLTVKPSNIDFWKNNYPNIKINYYKCSKIEDFMKTNRHKINFNCFKNHKRKNTNFTHILI